MAKKPEHASSPGDNAHGTGTAPTGLRGVLARLRWAYVIGIVAGLTLTVAGYLVLSRAPEIPASQQLETALRLLGEGRDQSARRIATTLQEKGYQDPSFPGGVPFILGICAFREAAAHDDLTRDRQYVTAVSFLREAERLSVPEERRPEWAYAIGMSLYRIDLPDEDSLKEAFETCPEKNTKPG